MIKPWPLVSSENLADLGIFKLNRDRALSPRTDQEGDFYIIHMPDWLQVVALTRADEVVLVRQYRHASREIGLEVPGGLLDPKDPNPAQAAARELQEETGYAGEEISQLGSFWPQPALLANQAHFFAITGVELMSAQEQDGGEDIEVVLAKTAELDELIARGEIHNAMTVFALGLARGAGMIKEGVL